MTTKVYEHPTGPQIDGSGLYLGIVWLDPDPWPIVGAEWGAQDRVGVEHWFVTEAAARRWLAFRALAPWAVETEHAA